MCRAGIWAPAVPMGAVLRAGRDRGGETKLGMERLGVVVGTVDMGHGGQVGWGSSAGSTRSFGGGERSSVPKER